MSLLRFDVEGLTVVVSEEQWQVLAYVTADDDADDVNLRLAPPGIRSTPYFEVVLHRYILELKLLELLPNANVVGLLATIDASEASRLGLSMIVNFFFFFFFLIISCKQKKAMKLT
jgi:hypothetical protein